MLSDLSAALAQTFAPQLVRAWNRSTVFLQNLTFLPGGGQGGGKNIAWDVEFGGATANAYSEGADVDASEFSEDKFVPASLGWGQYRAAFKLTHTELNAAYNNMGNPAELDRLVEERFLGAITAMTAAINRDALTGTGVDAKGRPTIVGVLPALQATGVYAGISKATYPEWAGNVIANGGVARPLTPDLLAGAEQLTYVSRGTSPEMILCTPGIHTRYEALFETVTRLVNDGSGPIQGMHSGSKRLFWRGIELTRERELPPGTVLMLRPTEVEMRVLPWADVPDGVPMTLRELLSSKGDDAGERLGAFVHIYPLAKTGSAVKFAAEIMLQLKVKLPSDHALLQDVTEG